MHAGEEMRHGAGEPRHAHGHVEGHEDAARRRFGVERVVSLDAVGIREREPRDRMRTLLPGHGGSVCHERGGCEHRENQSACRHATELSGRACGSEAGRRRAASALGDSGTCIGVRVCRCLSGTTGASEADVGEIAS